MNRNDYRITKDCIPYTEGIIQEKINLKNKIKDISRYTNMYNAVKADYKIEFMDIFNNRCSYCGITEKSENFEIDHIFPKSGSSQDVNDIENLTLSCNICNRKKSDFVINSELHPDSNIKMVFHRTSNYKIEINEDNKEDKTIVEFYYKIGLDSEIRRLDFILLKLEKIKEIAIKVDNSRVYMEIDRIKNIIQSKRNCSSIYSEL